MAIRHAADGLLDDRAIFLTENSDYKICDEDGKGIQCAQHSHVGTSGKPGSVQMFANLPGKYNIGHGHGAHQMFRGVHDAADGEP